MRVFMALITFVIMGIVIHNYFGGFTSRKQDTGEQFSKHVQTNVEESVSEHDKKLRDAIKEAGAE